MSADDQWPDQKEYNTFEEYALACSVWMREHPNATLLKCQEGEPIVYFDDMPPAKGPGHIYSEAGWREYNISGYCEFHFDAITQSIDDESQSGDPQGGEESPNNAQSGDSVIVHDEIVQGSLSKEDFDRLWDAHTFDNDDPTRPEPM
jgi:hypothetical protein